MSKSLLEMATTIVAAQVKHNPLSMDEVVEYLHKIFQTLQAIQESDEEEDEGLPLTAQSSIQRHQVICLECGMAFKLLSHRHLALHGLTARTYKQKHGIRMTQPLSARTLSAERRRLAKERGIGKQLQAWHANRRDQAG